jgi:hypothetical protein
MSHLYQEKENVIMNGVVNSKPNHEGYHFLFTTSVSTITPISQQRQPKCTILVVAAGRVSWPFFAHPNHQIQV